MNRWLHCQSDSGRFYESLILYVSYVVRRSAFPDQIPRTWLLKLKPLIKAATEDYCHTDPEFMLEHCAVSCKEEYGEDVKVGSRIEVYWKDGTFT
jgi:hypothetical protein